MTQCGRKQKASRGLLNRGEDEQRPHRTVQVWRSEVKVRLPGKAGPPQHPSCPPTALILRFYVNFCFFDAYLLFFHVCLISVMATDRFYQLSLFSRLSVTGPLLPFGKSPFLSCVPSQLSDWPGKISPGTAGTFGKEIAFFPERKPGVFCLGSLVLGSQQRMELTDTGDHILMTYLRPWIHPCLSPHLTQDFPSTFFFKSIQAVFLFLSPDQSQLLNTQVQLVLVYLRQGLAT